MRGKSWSIPTNMVLKKNYCHKCGTKLDKEKTHRVVTKDDPDYYNYHEVGHYPLNDYDVYSYRFMCPHCKNRMSAKEQSIISRIQKKCKFKVLSEIDLETYYDVCKNKDDKNDKFISYLVPNIMILIVYIILYFYGNLLENILFYAFMLILFEVFLIVGNKRSRKGKYVSLRKPGYTKERKELLNKLHSYASNNKELIMKANRVHCFYCKSNISYKDIKEYIDNDSTGICPYCGVDSLLPDSMDELIDEEIINDMNRYWF